MEEKVTIPTAEQFVVAELCAMRNENKKLREEIAKLEEDLRKAKSSTSHTTTEYVGYEL